MPDGAASRFLGGPPLSVAVRLILLCVVVGFILHALGFDPFNIWWSLRNLAQSIWDMGFDALRWVWGYFLLGAVIVIPIWLIVRLAKGGKG